MTAFHTQTLSPDRRQRRGPGGGWERRKARVKGTRDGDVWEREDEEEGATGGKVQCGKTGYGCIQYWQHGGRKTKISAKLEDEG